MQRILALTIAVISVLGLILMSTFYGKTLFILNQTKSLPRGFYRVIEQENYRRGDLVVFHIPDTIRTFIQSRFQMPDNAYLMKYIVGLPGDTYTVKDGIFIVENDAIGAVLKHDNNGKPMPVFEYNGVLKSGVLVAKKGLNLSIDSRYFGPVPRSTIIGRAEPFFLFE